MHLETACDNAKAERVCGPEVSLTRLPPLSISHHTGPALLKAEQEPGQSSEL